MLYPNIAAERVRRQMSLDDLAKELDVARKTIYNWETSGNIPQWALERMSDLFGVDIDYLLSHPVQRKNSRKDVPKKGQDEKDGQ